MSDKPKRPRDANQLAKFILDVATGESTVEVGTTAQREAGKKGGQARAAKLSSPKKLEIARAAAKARWGNGNDTSSSG